MRVAALVIILLLFCCPALAAEQIFVPAVDADVMRSDIQLFPDLRAGIGNGMGDHANPTISSGAIAWTPEPKYSTLYRGLFSFDTTFLPDDAIVTAAWINITTTYRNNGLGGPTASVVFTDIAPGSWTNIIISDYQRFGDTDLTERILLDDIAAGTDETHQFIMNAAGRNWISKTHYTMVDLRISNDVDDVTPPLWSAYGREVIRCYSIEGAPSNDMIPLLVVQYNLPTPERVVYTGAPMGEAVDWRIPFSFVGTAFLIGLLVLSTRRKDRE